MHLKLGTVPEVGGPTRHLPNSGLPVIFFLFPNMVHFYLCNRNSYPIGTWYGVLGRGPACGLQNSGPLIIYFLFRDLVHYWTLHDAVHKIRHIFLSNRNSHSLETWYGASSRGFMDQ